MSIGTKEAVAVAVPYLIAVGACHLFGYWGAFNINVLEFIGFADLGKLAVYPLVASLASSLAGVLFTQLVLGPHFPPGGGNASKVGTFGLKHWRWLIALQLTITVLVAAFGPEPSRWFIVACLISLFSTPLSHIDKLVELVPDPRTRSTALFLLLLLPPASFAYGRLQASFVQSGNQPAVCRRIAFQAAPDWRRSESGSLPWFPWERLRFARGKDWSDCFR